MTFGSVGAAAMPAGPGMVAIGGIGVVPAGTVIDLPPAGLSPVGMQAPTMEVLGSAVGAATGGGAVQSQASQVVEGLLAGGGDTAGILNTVSTAFGPGFIDQMITDVQRRMGGLAGMTRAANAIRNEVGVAAGAPRPTDVVDLGGGGPAFDRDPLAGVDLAGLGWSPGQPMSALNQSVAGMMGAFASAGGPVGRALQNAMSMIGGPEGLNKLTSSVVDAMGGEAGITGIAETIGRSASGAWGAGGASGGGGMAGGIDGLLGGIMGGGGGGAGGLGGMLGGLLGGGGGGLGGLLGGSGGGAGGLGGMLGGLLGGGGGGLGGMLGGLM